jgi:hypothetical protein
MSTQKLSNEQREKVQSAGRNLLLYIYAMFKTGEIHDLNNDAWLRPSEKISDVLRELFKYEKRRVTFILYEGTAQINAHALWLDKSTLETTQELEQFFAQREIGGIVFREVPREDSLKEFFYQVSRFALGESEEAAHKALTDILVKRGVSAITIAPRPTRLEQVGTGVRGVRSIWTYAKSVAAFTEIYNRKPIEVKQARRLVQEIVDTCSQEQDLTVALALAGGDRSRERLSVDVAILCVALGRGLGLSRTLCGDLALAGLLSEIGGAYLSERNTKVDRSFAVAGLTFRQLAEGSSLTNAFLNRVGVAVEWAEPARDEAYHLVGAPTALPMSALVRSCRNILGKVHGLQGPPTTVLGALTQLRAATTLAADKRALSLFALTIGFLPVGSLVKLQNNDLAVVTEIDHIRSVRAFSAADLPLAQTKKVYVSRLLTGEGKAISERDARVCLGAPAPSGEWTVHSLLSGLGLENHVLHGLFPNAAVVRSQLGVQ